MSSAPTFGSGSTQPLERLGPKLELSVYWVGHSLVEAKSASEWGEQSLMSLIGRFAEARNLSYRMGDHTLWGSPISALWRGHPHGYKRDSSVMVAKRERFERSATQYDTLVVTEALPLEWSLNAEYSSFYLRKFYCTLKQEKPEARVYLYQSWLNFQGSDPNSKFPPPQKLDLACSPEVRPRMIFESGYFQSLEWRRGHATKGTIDRGDHRGSA